MATQRKIDSNRKNLSAAIAKRQFCPVSELHALAAEVKRLREGLEHYADASNWMCHRQYNLHDCRTDTCWMGAYESGNGEGYDHARKILEGE